MTSVFEVRAQLATASDSQFVSAEEFISLLTSHHRWVRDDEPFANALGLRDADTGSRMLVAAEKMPLAVSLYSASM